MYLSISRTILITIIAFMLLIGPTVLAVEYEVNYLNSILWSDANAVTASGNYAYATTGYGVITIDISDPASPSWLSDIDLNGGKATNITIDGTHAFVANGSRGMAIIDISSSPAITLSAELGDIGNIVDVAISGNYAYLASTDSGMVVVDISDLDNPALVTCFTDSAGFDFVSVEDTVVAVARYGFALLLSIANPTVPTAASTIEIWGDSKGLFIHNSTVYIADPNELSAYDITDLANPTIADYNSFDDDIATMTNLGNYALVVTWMESYMVDISNPLSLSEDADFDLFTYNGKITSAGNLAFLASMDGVQIIDATDPLNPTEISSHDMDYGYFRGEQYGNDLIVSANSAGFKVIDVTDPASPTITAEIDSNYYVNSTTRVDSVLLVAHSNGMKILNFTDPTNPVEIGEVTTAGYTRTLVPVGNYVYAANSSKFVVFDITDRTAPVEIGSWTDSWYGAEEILIDGNYAYIANGPNRGFDIVDITDPANPAGLGTINPSGSSSRLDKSGNYVFLAAGTSGLQIIDVSNPLSPNIDNTWDEGYSVTDVDVVGTIAYVATYDAGLYLLDISDPTDPIKIVSHMTPNAPRIVLVDGEYVYLIENGGVCIMEAINTSPMGIDDQPANLLPDQITLQQNYPNPFNPSTTIEYSLKVSSKVTISVFNTLGQKVRTLFDGTMPVGDHRLEWDGCSDHGTQLATGVYFYRLLVGDQVKSKKMLLLK